jgi:hypothetical protein
LCGSGRFRSCFEPVAAGGNVGGGHPRAVSSVGCRCCVERVSSGVGRPPQGGRWASALHSELCWRRWPSGRRRRSRLEVTGELASDVQHRPRGSGNTSEQLDGVSSQRASERGRIMRSVGFLQAASPSGGAVRNESAAPCLVERHGTTLQASRRVPYCTLSRKWSPPNERAGSPSAATSMTRAVGSSARAARFASRVRGRLGSERALRSSIRRFLRRSGTCVGMTVLAQAGVEGGASRGDRWLPMRGEGHSRPSPIRRQSRAGVGRKPRVGEAAQVVCGGSYSGDATTSSSRSRAAAPRVGQSRRFRCRQRRRRGFGPKAVAKGIRP